MAASDESQLDTDERYKLGKKSLERALELDPTNIEIVRRLAMHYLDRARTTGREGRRSEAAAWLSRVDGDDDALIEGLEGAPSNATDVKGGGTADPLQRLNHGSR